jgi:hypothetical protein
MRETAILTHALEFWRRGLSVIPVPRPRPNVVPGQPGDGKVPAIAWREYQDRLPTEAEIRTWFSGVPMNLAIVAGAVSGVVVIDADDAAALRWCTQRLTYTPWQTRTPRGFHLWYAHPGVRIPNRARLETQDGRLAIDVRGDGGYVIAPGSVHASGATYECGGDWSVPRNALPRLWPGWLQRPAHSAPLRPSLPRSSGSVIERARRYLAAVPQPEIGHGSDTAVFRAASRLVRRFQLSTAEAEALLWEWAGNRPGWTREWIARKVLNAQRYATEPIGAVR